MNPKVPRPLDKVERKQVSDIPLDVSRDMLVDRKTKNSSSFKRTMKRSRQFVVELPRIAPKSVDVRLQARAKGCNMKQLATGIPRAIRYLRTLLQHMLALERLYEKFPSLDGLTERIIALRVGLKANLDLFNALKAEYESRTKRTRTATTS